MIRLALILALLAGPAVGQDRQWWAIFEACVPNAAGPDHCDRFVMGPWPIEARCHADRPFVRRILIWRLEDHGFGAAVVDEGRCEPPGLAM